MVNSQLFLGILPKECSMKRASLLLTIVLLTGFTLPQNNAAIESECLTEIKECFALSDEDRDICFQSTSKSAACRNDTLGHLAAKRAAFSSIAPTGTDDIASATEARLFDQECVQNFDTFWLSNIVNGSISSDTIENLHELLGTCEKSSSHDIMRP